MDESTVISAIEEAEATECGVEYEENEMIQSSDANIEDESESDSETTIIHSEQTELDTLREEVTRLRALIDGERAVYSRMNAECAEFNELYPSIPISSLPDEIWENVKRGVPIAAAYALEERRSTVADMKARAVNTANRTLSSGSIDSHVAEEFYTPDEVRAMSASEVRANYSKIISSMAKWH